MLVIADSSPLIVLINIGHVNALPELFGSIAIPPQVAAELTTARRPAGVRAFMATMPPWLIVRAPMMNAPIPLLQAGEIAAINLATEINADLLLIDEIQGRKAAFERKIKFTGTIGVLELGRTFEAAGPQERLRPRQADRFLDLAPVAR